MCTVTSVPIIPLMWKLCLQLVLIISSVECSSLPYCTMFNLDKVDGRCTARMDCQFEADFVLNTWECIQNTRYENNYDYGYYQRRKVTVIDDDYNLIIHIKDPLKMYSLRTAHETKYIELITEGGDWETVPEDVYEMKNLRELNITGSDIGGVNLNKFLSLSYLEKIVLKHNMIRVIEMSENYNASIARQISSVQLIDLSNNLLEALPNNFMSRFIQLQHLDLSHNMISSIGLLTFEGIVQLQTLDLSHNRLLEVGHALARFGNLKELSISHNNITMLFAYNFELLLNLEKLNASANGITTIENSSFRTLSKLKEIDLRHNDLIIISNRFFVNNVNLNSLLLSDNEIQSIEENSFKTTRINEFCIQNNALTGALKKNVFEGISVLDLNLSGGNLTSIKDGAFANMSQLNNLNLSSNFISNLSFSAFTSLISLNILDLSHNQLKEFNFDSQSLKNLTKLYAHNNSIEIIIKKVFDNFLSLKELDLSYNDLSQIEPSAFIKLTNTVIFNIENSNFVNTLRSKQFDGLTSLKKIYMSGTKTSLFQNESFSGLSALTDVNYTCGQLTKIEYNAFFRTGFLERLILTDNQLHEFCVNTTTISQIQEIYLNNNYIRNISNETFSHLTALRILNLANNKIMILNTNGFQDLYALTYLDLSSNEKNNISSNIFQNLSRLHSLSLENVKSNISFENSSASIEVINFQSCGIHDVEKINIFNVRGLSYLYLSMNEITSIERKSLNNITTLVTLDLSLNKIRYIQPGSFLHLKSLRNLNLYGNELSSIQFGVFDGIEVLKYLNLSSNVLSSFDVKLLPNTENLYLDDNIITEINFKDFLDTNLSELSIGGNQISCKIIAELKASNYSEKFKRIITAKTLNYHSENVNGISCQTADNITPTTNNTHVSNSPGINISPLITTLRNILEKLSQSLQAVRENTDTNDEFKSKETNVMNLLENIIKSYNKTQIKNNKYINQLTEINNNSNIQLGQIKKYLMQIVNKKEFESDGISDTKKSIDDHYLHSEFQKMLEQENDVLREEFKEALASISKGYPIPESLLAHKRDSDDSKSVIYFIAVCLAIMLSVYILNIVFKQIMASRRSYTHSGTTHITNSIEMD